MTHDYNGSPPRWTNSGEIELGMALGRILAGSERQTTILVEINSNLSNLPEKIASQLKTSSTTSVQNAPITHWPAIIDSLKGLMQVMVEALKAFLPILIIVGAITKKIVMPDIGQLLKASLGL